MILHSRTTRTQVWPIVALTFLVHSSCITNIVADEFVNVHFEPPLEEDVTVYQACLLDDNGFGGQASRNSITVQYYQEIVYRPGPDTSFAIVRDVELATVDALLDARRITCAQEPDQPVIARIQTTKTDGTNNHKKEEEEEKEGDDDHRRRQTQQQRRQLQSGRRAVGISANPDDEILELDCQTPPTNGNECVVVDSGFSVFYVGQDNNDNDANDGAFQQEFLNEVTQLANDGTLNNANGQIVGIGITDPETYTRPPDGTDGGRGPPDGGVTPQSNSTLPIVLGVLVGTLLIGAAGVAYRRSQKARQEALEASDNGTGGTGAAGAATPQSPPTRAKPEEGDV